MDHPTFPLAAFRTAALSLLTASILALPTAMAAPVAAAPAQPDDIRDRLTEIPGLTVVEEKPTEPGFRYFVLAYTQPADHDDPDGGSFEQRLTLLHRGFDRPTVLQTSGYGVGTTPSRSEPTRLVDGNQVSTEQRFFGPSRPDPTDWDDLDIEQAAADHHRIVDAIDAIYTGAWLSTGGSKGGMTSVYHRRFYPDDVNGTVAYVAPHDNIDREDRAYIDFFDTVGDDPACQQDLEAVQRTALERRGELVDHYEGLAADNGWTFDRTIGSSDRAFEMLVLDTAYIFWQYTGMAGCGEVPAADAPTAEIAAFLDNAVGFEPYTDQGTLPYVPYYYQAVNQLGTPSVPTSHLKGLLRYKGLYQARSYLPDELADVRHDNRAMPDIDRWVRKSGTEMLFVDGEYDPWSAEPFTPGSAPGQDSHRYVAPGGTHGSTIAALSGPDREAATATVRRWAGLDGGAAALRDARIPALDGTEPEWVTHRRPL
ncbi:PS-10 peptidase S37 [Murinocardiopsis flavida]|uniref:PS-10 peptidase S37 n=1 Tax=Murinocardiopsis flavida TaxID=645275 RepID=A0A2P8DLA7_9ACTN|nr:S28 family serine protease [Murinocardiopsis flavida]PSK98005.1 PS-10 peptidase S37 [Murinocardiopsis flavida]